MPTAVRVLIELGGEDEGVGAAAATQGVGPQTAGDLVGAASPIQAVIAFLTEELVIPPFSIGGVIAAAGIDGIGPSGTGACEVVAVVAVERVVALAREDEVIACGASEAGRRVLAIAIDDVATTFAEVAVTPAVVVIVADAIVPRAAIQQIAAISAADDVAACTAIDGIPAIPSLEGVITGATVDQIVTVLAVDEVVAPFTVHGVIAATGIDPVIAADSATQPAVTIDAVIATAGVDEIAPHFVCATQPGAAGRVLAIAVDHILTVFAAEVAAPGIVDTDHIVP